MEKIEKMPLISYSCLFPPNRLSIDDFIGTLPSQKSIEWVSYLHFWKYKNYMKQSDRDFFKTLLPNLNIELKKKIDGFIEEVDEKDYYFIDNVALFILLEKLLKVHNDNISELSEADYSNLMIAYLMCCDERGSLNADIVDVINEDMDADSFVRIYLPERLKYYDIEYRDVYVEFIRSMMFQDFCEEDYKFHPLFNLYLDRMNISDWGESKFFIPDLINRIKKSDNHFCGIKIDSDSYMKKYLDAMSMDISKYIPSPDFKGLREKPIYYHGDNKYHILSFNFLLDKLFQSFLFDFAKVLVKEKKIKDYPALKKDVGDLFSEKYLFYAIMKGCFEQTCDVSLSGQNLKECLKEEEPDYYLRKGNNIFLFEFKDVMLNAKTKHCNSYDEIVKELLELFERSTEEKSTGKIKYQRKGITQLLNVIENKLDQIINDIDKVESSEELNIFPVIIFQDYNFDIEGVNYILNNRFKKLLKSRNIPEHYIIKDLVMFSLTTLIQLEDLFSKGKLNLEQIIMNYFTYCSDSERNKTTPFYKFILRYAINEKGYNQENTKRYNDIINSVEKKIIK